MQHRAAVHATQSLQLTAILTPCHEASSSPAFLFERLDDWRGQLLSVCASLQSRQDGVKGSLQQLQAYPSMSTDIDNGRGQRRLRVPLWTVILQDNVFWAHTYDRQTDRQTGYLHRCVKGCTLST